MQAAVARGPGLFRRLEHFRIAVGSWAPERMEETHLLHVDRARPLQLVQRQPLDLAQQRHDHVPLAELDGQRGSVQQTPAAARRPAELGGAGERGHRDRERTPVTGAISRLFELQSDVLVLARQQRGAMPGTAIGLVAQHAGERVMCTLAIGHARALGHGRANERMAELQRLRVRVDRDDPGLGRRDDLIELQVGPGNHAACLKDRTDRGVLGGRGDEQEDAGQVRQIRHSTGERALQPLRQRQRVRAGQLQQAPTGRGRELQDRERIARRFAQHLRAHRRRKLRRRPVEQLGRRGIVEPIEPMLRQPHITQNGLVPITDRDQQEDRVRLDPPGKERQHIGGRLIEPLSVVDQQQHGPLTSHVREQIERPHRDPELLGHDIVSEPERSVERRVLKRRQRRHVSTHRTKQLMQTRIGQMRLGLHAGRGQQPHVAFVRRLCGLRQQSGLADPRLAAENQRLAARGDCGEQRREQAPFPVAADERNG